MSDYNQRQMKFGNASGSASYFKAERKVLETIRNLEYNKGAKL